jgi:hypothetical protein
MGECSVVTTVPTGGSGGGNTNTDTTPPVITLIGDTTVTLTLGDTYIESGATAVDDTDGDITANIVVAGTVDTGVAGTYTITYNVSDSASNMATEVARTVVVQDLVPTPPPVDPPITP